MRRHGVQPILMIEVSPWVSTDYWFLLWFKETDSHFKTENGLGRGLVAHQRQSLLVVQAHFAEAFGSVSLIGPLAFVSLFLVWFVLFGIVFLGLLDTLALHTHVL